MTRGARRRPRRRAWQHGGSALRREHVSDHGVARGAAWELHRALAVLAREKENEKEDGGASSTERSTPASSATTPVSDYRLVKAYHGEPTRARGERGGGGAQGETEQAQVDWSGRNGQLRRGSWCERWRARALQLSKQKAKGGAANGAVSGSVRRAGVQGAASGARMAAARGRVVRRPSTGGATRRSRPAVGRGTTRASGKTRRGPGPAKQQLGQVRGE